MTVSPLNGFGSAYGIRTRVTAVRGRRPGPLDECAGVAWDAEDTEGKFRSQGRLTASEARYSGRRAEARPTFIGP